MAQQYESTQCGGNWFRSQTGAQWRQVLNAAMLASLVGLAGCQDSSSSGDQVYPAPFPADDGGTPGNGQGPVEATQGGLPIVDAGGDQAADPNVLILLNGDAEAAAGARIVKVSWSQVSGPNVQILTPDQETTQILTPDVEGPTQLRFRLTATDELGRVNSDTVALTVAPMPADLRVVSGTVVETDENFDFLVRLRRPINEPIVFHYQTLDGTAVAGEDYLAVEGEMTIAAGQIEAMIPVVLLPDTIPEANEYFFLKLTILIQGQTVASSGALAIFDDDPPPSNNVTIQGVIKDYPELKSQANIVVAPNGYRSASPSELKISVNGEEQTVSAMDGSYGFRTPLAVDVSYEAHITQQPGRLTCVFGDGELNTLLTPSAQTTSLDIQCALPVEPTLRRVDDVAVGDRHTCALDQSHEGAAESNLVTCWGDDFYPDFTSAGENGGIGRIGSGVTRVPFLHNPVSLDAGERHTCVIDEFGNDTSVRCWGVNFDGQTSVPDTLVNPRAVSAGGAHSCALDDNGLVCWGEESAANVPAGIVDPVTVSAGADHTCVIDAGKVFCWGGGYGADVWIESLIAPTAVESGNGFSCALHGGEGGPEVTCWREGYETGYETLVLEELQTLNPISLDVNGDLACVVHETTEGSKVSCWFPKEGELLSGLELLDNSTTVGAYGDVFQPYDPQVSFESDDYRIVVCGVVDGELRCLGDNRLGQATVPELTGASSLVATYTSFCVQGSNGVSCWGRNPETPDLAAPALLTAGFYHSCALDRASNEVVCWGHPDLEPEPDLFQAQTSVLTPMQALAPVDFADVSSLAAGSRFTCALAGGAITCWDFFGTDPGFALGVSEHTDFFAMAAGDNHMCALRRGFKLPVCWDRYNQAELLDVPDNLVNPRMIAAGDDHTCVLDDNGVWCWGRYYDEISVPVLSNPREIFALRSTTCANDDTGTHCWDFRGSEQLRQRIPTLRNPKSIGYEYDDLCALDDEAIKCSFVYYVSAEGG